MADDAVMRVTFKLDPLKPRDPYIAEAMRRVSTEYAGRNLSVVETWLALAVQPRPRWCPERVWRWVLKRVLVLHQGPRRPEWRRMTRALVVAVTVLALGGCQNTQAGRDWCRDKCTAPEAIAYGVTADARCVCVYRPDGAGIDTTTDARAGGAL